MAKEFKFDSLVEAWIRVMLKESSDEHDPDFWAFSNLDRMIDDEPENAWSIILEILRRNQSSEILEVLSAGPVEDLLARHGEAFIERVENEARNDEDFAKLLGGVWQNTMSDEIYARVQRVWNRKGWDGN
jgi:Family of unknown function (DUF6869)